MIMEMVLLRKTFILVFVLIIAVFTLSACSKGAGSSAKEISLEDIKDDKAKQMMELLNSKDGAHIFMGEKEFYLFLNASNGTAAKPVEFTGLTVSYDKSTKVLTLDYSEKEVASKDNLKNKVIYKIPVSEKPDRLKLLKNGQSTPVTTLGS